MATNLPDGGRTSFPASGLTNLPASGFSNLPSSGLNLPAGGFIPPDMADVTLWLDGFDVNLLSNAGIANNDPIGTWKNKGSQGSGNDWLQATEALKPLFKTTGINGHPALLWAATKEMAGALSPVAQTAARHIFIVYEVVSGAVGSVYSSRQIGTVSYNLLSRSDDTLIETNGATANNQIPAAPAAGNSIIEWSFDGVTTNNPTYTINGVAKTVTNAVGTGVDIESGAAGCGSNIFGGHIGEVIVYNVVKSAGVVSVVRAGLAAKWGITV